MIKIGEPAPDFFLASSRGAPVRLSEYRGRKTVVLYFYPKDNTPGCTVEGQQFRDLHPRFAELGAVVAGVSRDSLKSHENFKAKMEFPFELISDADEALCAQFAVIRMKNMYGKQVRGIERSTFVFDTIGRLVKSWRGLKAPGHAAEVLAFVQSL